MYGHRNLYLPKFSQAFKEKSAVKRGTTVLRFQDCQQAIKPENIDESLSRFGLTTPGQAKAMQHSLESQGQLHPLLVNAHLIFISEIRIFPYLWVNTGKINYSKTLSGTLMIWITTTK